MSASKVLILAGLFLMVLGVFAYLGERLGLGLGRLPGDLVIRGERTTLYFPVVTCLVLSLLLSLGFWIVRWLRR